MKIKNNTKKRINLINLFFNEVHNHVYVGTFKNNDYYCLFKCNKCNHEIELFILENIPDDYSAEFVERGYAYEYMPYGSFYICYLGNSKIFNKEVNNDILANMLTCDEVIIKEILE